MKKIRVSDSEWEVMEVLWDRSPLSSNEVIEVLSEINNWAPNTVRTMLVRLVEKKVLSSKKKNGVLVYAPLLSRHQCVGHESDSFLKRVFKGAAKPLLLHFVNQTKLSKEDIKELQKILEDKGKK